jgi:glycosyltransferase involved in cell wall biosynthesis
MIVAGIPAYNEEKTIAKVILLAQKFVDKVIVCDDGSTDFTAQIARKLGAKVIRHEKNLGYGAALRSLFEETRTMNAEILLTLDADGQHDPREIPKLLQPLLDNKADIVIGSRLLKKSNNIPSYRRFGIKLLTKVTGGGETRLSDAQCGFRAYNKKALQSLTIRENGMGASAEILLEARNQGFRVIEVPVEAYYKGLDTSTHNPFRHGLDVLSTIIKLIVEERPLVYLGFPGVGLLFVGLFFGLWTLQIYAREGRVVTNIALASVAFGLIGAFAIFTAITLYAILRLTQKVAS